MNVKLARTPGIGALLCIWTLAVGATLQAAGYPPWEFGMTKEQVTSFQEFAPYRAFSNGDPETLNGEFHGAKANVQFFFEGGRVNRIGIYLFEGTDPKQAIPAWRRAYEALEKDYGKILAPNLPTSEKGGSVDIDAMAMAAITSATADAATKANGRGETLVSPEKQPSDVNIHCSVMTAQVNGQRFYYVAVFYDLKN